MRWSLLFLVACGGSDAGLLNLGEASAPVMDAAPWSTHSDATPESSTDGSTTKDTWTEADLDSGAVPADVAASSPDGAYDARSTSATSDADYACDLTCEPMCIRLMHPMHACCSRVGCNCTTSDAGGYCAP